MIPLSRYSVFAAFRDRVCPSGKFELNLTFENDENLLFKGIQVTPAGGNQLANVPAGRYVMTSVKLMIPKMNLSGEGGQNFITNFAKSQSWRYLKENVLTSTVLKTRNDTFKISESIKRPRHVFVWFENQGGDQEKNRFIFDTNQIGDAKVGVSECQLILGNNLEYPQIPLDFVTEKGRTYRELLRYGGWFNDYLSSPTLSAEQFYNVYPMLYFDLTNQPIASKDSLVTISFKYKLSGAVTGAEGYVIRAVVLNQEEIEIDVVSGKALLKA